MCQNHFQHPQVFRELLLSGCLSETNLHHTADWFFMADQSVAAMLLANLMDADIKSVSPSSPEKASGWPPPQMDGN